MITTHPGTLKRIVTQLYVIRLQYIVTIHTPGMLKRIHIYMYSIVYDY